MAIDHVYAEHLLNLRQVTVFATLSTSSNDQTSVDVVSNGQALCIIHEGNQKIVKLPCTVVQHLQPLVPQSGIKDLSFRFEAQSRPLDSSSFTAELNDGGQWTAATLEGGMQVVCVECKHLLVENVMEWKDLPSGGWADMMDLWHCHKPSRPNGVSDNVGNTKGYAAGNALGPTAGCGLVDASSFYFLPDDCSDIEIMGTEREMLRCSSCAIRVGNVTRTHHFELYKWSVALRSNENLPWRELPLQTVISARLLALIEDQAVRRFFVYNDEPGKKGPALILWVFTPNLVYASEIETSRAMKVFYKLLDDVSMHLNNSELKMEELRLSDDALKELKENLEFSTTILPPSGRRHQDWAIGLLRR